MSQHLSFDLKCCHLWFTASNTQFHINGSYPGCYEQSSGELSVCSMFNSIGLWDHSVRLDVYCMPCAPEQ